MPTLVKILWMGVTPRYSIDYSDTKPRVPRQGEARVPITDEQAAKGIEFCGLLYEAGRLG